MKLLKKKSFSFSGLLGVWLRGSEEIVCTLHPSWLMVGFVVNIIFYFIFLFLISFTPTPTTNHNTNTGGCVDWWVTINHRRVVAAALLREKGEKKKRGDQQEGRSCSVLSKMVAQILIMLVICQAHQ